MIYKVLLFAEIYDVNLTVVYVDIDVFNSILLLTIESKVWYTENNN